VPRPKTDMWYAIRVSTYAEDGMSAAAIARKLEEDAAEAKRKDVPSVRTVRRLFEAHRASPEAERLQANRFRWPESMMLGLLPWEASATALNYLLFRQGFDRTRPTCREVKWYWRLHLASPSMSYRRAHIWTEWLAAWEYARGMGDPGALEIHEDTLEAQIAIEPWESKEGADVYEEFRHLFNAEPFHPDAVSVPFTSAILHRYIGTLKGREWADVIVAKEREIAEAGDHGVGDEVTRLNLAINPDSSTSVDGEENG
jgi:hypothetical protein